MIIDLNTAKICVNQLFMLLVGLPVSSRLLVVKILGSQKFSTAYELVPLTPVSFKGQ